MAPKKDLAFLLECDCRGCSRADAEMALVIRDSPHSTTAEKMLAQLIINQMLVINDLVAALEVGVVTISVPEQNIFFGDIPPR